MARKNEGLLEVLMVLPWWVGVTAATVIFVGLRFVVPLAFDGSARETYVATIRLAAWVLSGACLLAAALSAIRSLFGRNRPDR